MRFTVYKEEHNMVLVVTDHLSVMVRENFTDSLVVRALSCPFPISKSFLHFKGQQVQKNIKMFKYFCFDNAKFRFFCNFIKLNALNMVANKKVERFQWFLSFQVVMSVFTRWIYKLIVLVTPRDIRHDFCIALPILINSILIRQ